MHMWPMLESVAVPEQPVPAPHLPAAAVAPAEERVSEEAAEAAVSKEFTQPEKPKDPGPTRTTTPAKPAPIPPESIEPEPEPKPVKKGVKVNPLG